MNSVEKTVPAEGRHHQEHLHRGGLTTKVTCAATQLCRVSAADVLGVKWTAWFAHFVFLYEDT